MIFTRKGLKIINISPLTLENLFEQLGLKSSKHEIIEFLNAHAPIPRSTKLSEASFWSESQAQFLKEALNEDSEWALLADELNQHLRLSIQSGKR